MRMRLGEPYPTPIPGEYWVGTNASTLMAGPKGGVEGFSPPPRDLQSAPGWNGHIEGHRCSGFVNAIRAGSMKESSNTCDEAGSGDGGTGGLASQHMKRARSIRAEPFGRSDDAY